MSDEATAVAPGDIVEAMRRNPGYRLESSPPDVVDTSKLTNWRDIQMSWKETCYIGYWSFMPDLHVSGPDAKRLFSDLSVNTFDNFPVGKAKQSVQCNTDGKVIGDGILMRTDEDEFRIQNLAAWPTYNAETGDYDVTAEVHDSFIYQVQGPNALEVMESVTDDDLRSIGFLNFAEITINGHEVIALRQGMSGEVGFELQGPRECGHEIYRAVLEAGEEYGIQQLQSNTRLINHLEMSFSTAGFHYIPAVFGDDMKEYREWLTNFDEGRGWTNWDNFNSNYSIEGSFDADDISAWYRSPVELGWGRNINFDHDFVGREALEDEVENPTRTIVTLEWNDEDVVDAYATLYSEGEHAKFMELPMKQHRTVVADEVRKDGERVGVSTGRGYSYYFRNMLSLCTIDVEHSEPGTEVTVVWGEGKDPTTPTVEPHLQTEVRATVAPAPYKQDRRRSKL